MVRPLRTFCSTNQGLIQIAQLLIASPLHFLQVWNWYDLLSAGEVCFGRNALPQSADHQPQELSPHGACSCGEALLHTYQMIKLASFVCSLMYSLCSLIYSLCSFCTDSALHEEV